MYTHTPTGQAALSSVYIPMCARPYISLTSDSTQRAPTLMLLHRERDSIVCIFNYVSAHPCVSYSPFSSSSSSTLHNILGSTRFPAKYCIKLTLRITCVYLRAREGGGEGGEGT